MEYLQTLQEIFLAEDRYLYILNGLGFSVGVTLFAAILGVLLGILLALMKLSNSKILSKIALVYIDIVRGTPAVVQLMILANIIFVGALRETPILIVAGIAFGMNSGAYVAEIIRAGIEGLEKGQTEAGRALGLSYAQTMKFVIIPKL